MVVATLYSYDLFAETYNLWMAEDFCRRVSPVVERLLLARLPAAAPHAAEPCQTAETCAPRLLDVCCGSGQMARVLTGRGFRVTGLDGSDAMLRLARRNAPAAEFIRLDARSFHLPAAFAGALSTFNSLAHIETVGELEAVFRNVRAALVPGAAFLFDLSMEEAYRSRWRGSFGLVAEDRACIVRPSYDPARQRGRNEITLFRAVAPVENQALGSLSGLDRVRAGPDRAFASRDALGWLRSDFCIEQKCHSASDLRAALMAAGFSHVESYDAQHDLGMAGEYGRMFFLCC